MNSIKLKKQSILGLQTLLIVTTIFATHFIFAVDNNTSDNFFTAPLTELYKRDHVLFVQDADSNKFVLKYPNPKFDRSPEHAIHDTLGAKIGLAAEININEVRIFKPYDQSISSVDKYHPEKIKTLHTLVPGKEIGKKQEDDLINGLQNESHLEILTANIGLCKIAALDTFLDNNDRHNENLFYKKKTNQYHAIDMDYIFPQALFLPNNNELSNIYDEHKPEDFNFMSSRSADFLKNLKLEQLSLENIMALKEYEKTLSYLISNYPPKKLYSEWMSIAQEVDYKYSESKQKNILTLIEYNFHETKLLQEQLQQLIKQAPATSSVY
jgi:hypothetical protein